MTKKQEYDQNVFDIDFDLDFDLSDFDLIDAMTADIGHTPEAQERILRPRIDKNEILHHVMFANAEEFAEQIDLSPNARTFAWLSGNFVFGDIIEALITRRRVGIKRLYISTLSVSQENIDSMKNVMLLMRDELEKIVLVVSGYQYSHEKYNLVPYMYRELDDESNRVQIAFGGWHTKIIAIETVLGNTLTIHGSANLRSSNSIEQIMVETSRDLFEFNANIMDGIAQRFGTINHNAKYFKLKRIEGAEAYAISKEQAKEN